MQPGDTPSTGALYLPPDIGAIPREGTLFLQGQTDVVRIPVTADSLETIQNDSDKYIKITVKDKRWKWKKGSLTWSFNVDPDDSGSPAQELSARQIAAGILDLLGESDRDISLLPDDEYPPMVFDFVPYGRALRELCDLYGMTPCLVNNGSGVWSKVTITRNDTSLLPSISTTYLIESPATIDRNPEIPEQIVVVGSQYVDEYTFECEPVGVETSGSQAGEILPITSLSYFTGANDPAVLAIGSEFTQLFFSDPDAYRNAKAQAYRWWRILPPAGMDIEDVLPLLKTRSTPVEDPPGSGKYRLARPEVRTQRVLNERQVSSTLYPVSSGYTIDYETGVIKFEEPVGYFFDTARPDYSEFTPNDVEIKAAFERKDNANTSDYPDDYYTRTFVTGNASANYPTEVIRDQSLVLYRINGVAQNQTQLDARADALIAQWYASVQNESEPRTWKFCNIEALDPVGGVASISWEVGEEAFTTVEVTFEAPPVNVPSAAVKTSHSRVRSDSQSARQQARYESRNVARGSGGRVQPDSNQGGGGEVTAVERRSEWRMVLNSDSLTGSAGSVVILDQWSAALSSMAMTQCDEDGDPRVAVAARDFTADDSYVKVWVTGVHPVLVSDDSDPETTFTASSGTFEAAPGDGPLQGLHLVQSGIVMCRIGGGSGSNKFLARITADNGSGGHSWVEVYWDCTISAWTTLSGGRTGTSNAYEINEFQAVPTNTIVEMWEEGGCDPPRYVFDVSAHPTTTFSTLTGSGETADTDEWEWVDKTGLQLQVITRVVYNPSGDRVLYEFYRVLEFDPVGRLMKAGPETRRTITTPIDCGAGY